MGWIVDLRIVDLVQRAHSFESVSSEAEPTMRRLTDDGCQMGRRGCALLYHSPLDCTFDYRSWGLMTTTYLKSRPLVENSNNSSCH